MTGNDIVKILLIILPIIFLIIIIIRNIITLKDIKKTFKCEYCNTLNTEISNGHKCCNCNRVFRNITKKWDYFLLFRIIEINTKTKKIKYQYKNYLKLPKIEITLCSSILSVFIIALIISIIL